MPLTEKGRSILRSMEKTYGDPEKAKEVLYASKNAGKITGVDGETDDQTAPVPATTPTSSTGGAGPSPMPQSPLHDAPQEAEYKQAPPGMTIADIQKKNEEYWKDWKKQY